IPLTLTVPDARAKLQGGSMHACIGDFRLLYGPADSPSILYQRIGFAYYNLKSACCEGAAVKATADAACQTGCRSAACGALLQQLDEMEYTIIDSFSPQSDCRDYGGVTACNGPEQTDCHS